MNYFEEGNFHYLNGDYKQARDCYLNALVSNPEDPDINCNLALTYYNLREFNEALKYCTIPANKNFSDSFTTRGAILRTLGNYEDAMADFLKSIKANPNNAAGYSNYGNSLREFGLPMLSIPYFIKAQELDPTNPQFKLNESIAYLLAGDWLNGWEKYEYRWFYESDKNLKPNLVGEEYNGTQDINGSLVLVYTEQGFGDCIQFCRYLPLLQQLGADVIFATRTELVDFMTHNFPTVRIIDNDKNTVPFTYIYHCALLELPKVFNTTVDTVPSYPYYLTSNPSITNHWKQKLIPKTKPRIGIAWNSNQQAWTSRFRQINLEELLSGIHNTDFDWVSLSVTPTDDEIDILAKYKVRDFHNELKTFADTAGLVDNLDLVITVDTAISHVGGSLGVKTWVMLSDYAVDWRWMLNRTDTPFYPNVTLYRQDNSNTWKNVLQSINNDLIKFGLDYK